MPKEEQMGFDFKKQPLSREEIVQKFHAGLPLSPEEKRVIQTLRELEKRDANPGTDNYEFKVSEPLPWNKKKNKKRGGK